MTSFYLTQTNQLLTSLASQFYSSNLFQQIHAPSRHRTGYLGASINIVESNVNFVLNSMAYWYIFGLLSKLYKYAPDVTPPPGIKNAAKEIGKEVAKAVTDAIYESNIENVHDLADAISDAIIWGIGKVGPYALSGFFLFGMQQIGISYLKKYLIDGLNRPTLSKKYHFDDLQARVYQAVSAPFAFVKSTFTKIVHGPEEKKVKLNPIFNASLQEQLNDITQGIQIASKRKGIFTNLLLWGPPGTGKSMTAQKIAEDSDMNYLEISGGDLAKFIGSNQSPLAMLDQVFARIEASKTPTVIFIDEIDAVAMDRSKMDAQRIEILNALLNHTGTPTNKFVLIGATNRRGDLDSAILNRFDDKLHMAPPAEKERLDILKLYANHFFKEPENQAIFSNKLLEELNSRLEGQTGRTISKLMNKCFLKKEAQKERRLTEELVLKTFDQFFQNEQDIEKDQLLNLKV